MITITDEQIEMVQLNLPSVAGDSFGWTESKIKSTLLSNNGSLAQTVRRFWYERVMETFEFVDVSETGSSRSLSQIHQNAKFMLDYWDKKVESEGVVTQRRPITFGRINPE